MSVNPLLQVQKVTLSNDSLRFITPCSISVTGPSQSGKTEFIINLIENRTQLFTSEFSRIIFCQPETLAHIESKAFERIRKSFPRVELLNGLPNISKLNLDLNHLPCLIVIDDQMTALLDSSNILELLTIKVHHFNLSVIISLHNFFAPSRYGKSITRNLNYLVFFKNPSDLRELRNISCQITPTHPTFMQTNFNFLSERFPNDPSHYIIVNSHHQSKMNNMHIYTHIFPNKSNEMQPIFFFPNPKYKK
jgi:hypothetical protein